ncbi:MAG: hypothetical protein HGB12_14030 [Bacteroidetes bacterium]|nr:hypothetical protein [Bacteroidota bacterium]
MDQEKYSILINTSDFQVLSDEFRVAETYLKSAERTDGLDIEAVRNLCNSAWSLLGVIKHPEEHENLKSAINACKYAGYEALKLGVVQMMEEFDEFKDEFKYDPISSVIINWCEYCEIVDKVTDKLMEQEVADIDKSYEELTKINNDLKGIIKELRRAKEELKKIAKENQFSTNKLIFGWLVAVAMLVLRSLKINELLQHLLK